MARKTAARRWARRRLQGSSGSRRRLRLAAGFGVRLGVWLGVRLQGRTASRRVLDRRTGIAFGTA